MPGIDVKRFVDLEEGLAKELLCGICLEVLDNAVDTDCGHTFCKSCITSAIQDNNRLVCPECRHESTIATNDDNECQLKTGLRINAVINKLKIRCDFADNGCDEAIEFGLLSAHLKNCPFNQCSNCGLSLSDKNINERLETRNAALTHRCRQLSVKCNELSAKVDELSHELDTLDGYTRWEAIIQWTHAAIEGIGMATDLWINFLTILLINLLLIILFPYCLRLYF